MTKSRNKSLIVLLVALACIIIVGITFAWAGFRASKETSLGVLKVSLDVDFNMQDSITEVSRGEEVVTYIKFSPKTDTSNCYVRAKLEYRSNNLADDNVKRFLLSANYEDFDTASDTTKGYKWVKHTDGYHYLVGTDGTIFEYTKSTATTADPTTFCENVTYKGAVSLYGTIDAPDDLTLYAEVQAVQSKNITDTSLDNLSTIFTETFGADPSYGHIVTFVTNTDQTIIAQTFFNDNGTVTTPTTPFKLGSTFSGWYTDSACTTAYDFSTTVTNSFTLYAGFVNTISITGATFGKYEAGTENASDRFNGFYYVDYGYYPQTLAVEGEDGFSVSNLTLVDGETYTLEDTTGARAECPVYTNGANKYVQFTMTSSNSSYYNSSTHTQYKDTHYYKIEPVRWLILGYGDNTAIADGDISVTNGSLTLADTSKGLLVLSEKVLIQQRFNPQTTHTTSAGTTTYSDWEKSEIRKFMNTTFINDVFKYNESDNILPQDLTTTYRDTSGSVSTLNTEKDKLFLLSCTQSSYNTDNYQVQQGLKSGTNNGVYGTQYVPLQAKASDLAFATGCYQNNGNTYWWLRAGYYSYNSRACFVFSRGIVSYDFVDSGYLGSRAAFVMAIA